MQAHVPHLITRNGIYYLRLRLPRHLVLGREEVKFSLRTRELDIAMSRAMLVIEKRPAIFNGVSYLSQTPNEGGASSLSGEKRMQLCEIKKRINAYIIQSLEAQERYSIELGPVCNASRAAARNTLLAMSNVAEEALSTRQTPPWADSTASELMRGAGATPTDLALAAQEFLRGFLYIARVKREELEGKRFGTDFTEQDKSMVLNGNYPLAKEIIAAEHTDPIGDLTRQYLQAPHSWCVKMADDVENTLNLLCESFGAETDIKKLTRREMRNFRDNVLIKIPARRNVLPRFKKMTLTELVACKDAPKLSLRSVNHNLARLSGFFSWCVEGEYLASNPVSGLTMEIDAKANTEREPYDRDELVKIFTELREDRLHAWQPFKYWIPLIMLYSGCRQNEACQLFASNLIMDDGILCFDLLEDETTGARVKNRSSIRRVPVHPILLKLGFLNYVIRLKAGKERQKSETISLWPQLKYTKKEGYARRFRTFFEDFNRKYITGNPKRSCYSFRHCFTNNLK